MPGVVANETLNLAGQLATIAFIFGSDKSPCFLSSYGFEHIQYLFRTVRPGRLAKWPRCDTFGRYKGADERLWRTHPHLRICADRKYTFLIL
jgi:hypothetical protein